MDRSDQNRAKRDKVSWKEGAQRDSEAVVTVIIYHGLGTLLPERWDPDKRSLRYRHQIQPVEQLLCCAFLALPF